jgi:zinc protease
MSGRPGIAAAGPGSVPAVSLPLERFTLASGARLLVTPRPGAPVCAIRLHLRGGPSLDPAGREGTAYLTGALVDQGTRSHDERALASLLEPAGGEVSGDATGLRGSIVSSQWRLLVGVMAELVREPVFPAADVRVQHARLLHRLAVERDDPRRQGGIRFRRLVYGDHWIGRPAYGTLESVARIEPRHLRAHHRKHWVAKRATIAVCGDVDPQAVRRAFSRALSGWEPGRPLPRREEPMPRPAVRTDVFSATREQVHLYLGHLGIRRRDPDYAALVVMDHILGTGPGFTNRIARRLRDELGLAYTVNASIHSSAGVLPGLFTAYIGTSPENVGVAVEGFLREIRRIQDEPVTADELEVARSYLLGSFSMGFDRASRRASFLVSREIHGLPDDVLERLPREFAAVGPEDIQRVARAHLRPDACCVCAAGPVSRPALRKVLTAG